MGKKMAKSEGDTSQRTLFQCGSFTPLSNRLLSPSRSPYAHEANKLKSASAVTPRSHDPMIMGRKIDSLRASEDGPRARQPMLPVAEPRLHQTIDFQNIAQAKLQDPSMSSLNDEQNAAAGAPFDRPIAIFAGAGTGKTTTLVARVWRMLAEGINPESILAITFTRKACQEIKDRLRIGNGGSKIPVNIFTFHGWAIRFLHMKNIRQMAEIPKRLVIWAQRDQKEHMAEACQRATVDHHLLPQARRVMDLPETERATTHKRWIVLLRTAFSDPALHDSMHSAIDRAKKRVQAALKEVGSPQKDGTEDQDHAEAEHASGPVQERTHDRMEVAAAHHIHYAMEQRYGFPNGPSAAPGASTFPTARMQHVQAITRNLAQIEAADSDREEAEVGSEHLKSEYRPGGEHWVDELFPDGSVETWTLVAKELLTTYIRQECGIEIVIAKQGNGNGAASEEDKRTRIVHFRQFYLYHRKPADGAPAHMTELDKGLLSAKTKALLEFRSWIRKNNAEGLEPDTFETVANEYYDARMKLLGALDFDEMLRMAEMLLENNLQARNIARCLYQYLLVDEFQDSNAVQIRIVKHLQDGRGNLTVVGDDAQSIYGFRGATNRAFVLLSEVLEHSKIKEYTMMQNYRSQGAIIQVGNCVLQKLMNEGSLRQKGLTCTRVGDTVPVQYHELGTGLAEARFIVGEIKRLHAEGYKYDDMAVLCRLNNSRFLFRYEFGVLHHIKMQLAKEAVPHRVFRGRQMTAKPEYILTVEVLKFLTNPLNDGALLTVLESNLSMKAGIGKMAVESLKRIVRDTMNPVPVWTLLHDLVRRRETATRKRNAVKKFLDWHSRVYGQVMFMALPEALLYVWKESGISADAVQRSTQGVKSNPQERNDSADLSAGDCRPEMSCSPQRSTSLLSHGLMRSRSKKRTAPDIPSPMSITAAEVLTSPTLDALYKNSQEFLTDWTGESMFLENFGELRLAGSSTDAPTAGPRSLLSLAAAAVMQLQQPQRVYAVHALAKLNPGLSDLILSVNKCGYGPIVEFVRHLDLNSSDVAEENGTDDHVKDGKVTLSTVHGCKGLEWPVVFVAKFIDNVMPIFFSYKKAIPVDSGGGAESEQMAIAAVQADARMRGKALKTHEDVVEYLPAWLKQDGLEPDNYSDSQAVDHDLDSGFPVIAERVSDCYKRKKAKQHDEEEIRLAHVAFTRAKDRLYVTSHRIAEGSADSSSLGTAITSQKGAVRRVQPTQSILLSDDPSVVTRTHHPIDEIEEYLGRCADETQARHSSWPRTAVGNVRVDGVGGEELADPEVAWQPSNAAVAAAQAVVQDVGQHRASGFVFMGAGGDTRQGFGVNSRQNPHRPVSGLPGNSGTATFSTSCLHQPTQVVAETLHGSRRRPPAAARQRASLSDPESDGSPLPLRQHITKQGRPAIKARRPLPNMGSETKAGPVAAVVGRHDAGALASGSPVALQRLAPTVGRPPAHRVPESPVVHPPTGRAGASPPVIDLTIQCDLTSCGRDYASGHEDCSVSHEHGHRSAEHAQRRRHRRGGNSKFQAPRRNA